MRRKNETTSGRKRLLIQECQGYNNTSSEITRYIATINRVRKEKEKEGEDELGWIGWNIDVDEEGSGGRGGRREYSKSKKVTNDSEQKQLDTQH